jgi:membrane-associated protease RseP (regulator of RpoE activity)
LRSQRRRDIFNSAGEEEECTLRKELLLPLAVLALGLAAAGGFFAASAALSEGGQKSDGSQAVVQEPEENGQVGPQGLLRRAFVGVVLANEPDGEGVRITQVIAGSPADDAGLQRGDVITAVDGQSVHGVDDVQNALEDKSPGDKVTFSVRRDNQNEDVDVTLGRHAEAVPMPQAPPTVVPPSGVTQAYLGVRLADITPEIRQDLDLAQDSGVVIVEVDRSGPAYAAGLRRGDVILMIGLQRVETADEAVVAIRDYEPGEKVPLIIRRGYQELAVNVDLASQPGTGSSVDLPQAQPPSQEWLRSLLSDLGLSPELDLTNLEELFGRFVRTDIVLLNKAGQPVQLHLAAGTITNVSDTEVRLAPNGGAAEQRYSMTEKTRVFRGVAEDKIDNLRPGDRALVLTRGASNEALLIYSPRFALEGGLSAVPEAGMIEITPPSANLH